MTNSSDSQTFHWDFFGPDGAPKALHFLEHLRQTLAQWGMEATPTGFRSEGEGHAEAYARVDTGEVDRLRATLRPNRVTD
ncbi:MAG: hypothetical protein KDC38_08115 [Planctomycetes bacterium]|nr:hypothetical protein [Planctomycetota bacterium]